MKKFQRGNRDTLIVFSRPWLFFDLHSQVCCCSQPETCCRRPYRVECTGSVLTSEVKQRRARSVLGWGTAWEDLRVLSAFLSLFPKWRNNRSANPVFSNTPCFMTVAISKDTGMQIAACICAQIQCRLPVTPRSQQELLLTSCIWLRSVYLTFALIGGRP